MIQMMIPMLRKPMQQINNYILKCMGVMQSADVIAIEPHPSNGIEGVK